MWASDPSRFHSPSRGTSRWIRALKSHSFSRDNWWRWWKICLLMYVRFLIVHVIYVLFMRLCLWNLMNQYSWRWISHTSRCSRSREITILLPEMWTVEGCSRPVEHTLLEFGHISNSWTGRSIPPSSGTSFDTLNCESDLNCLPFDIDIELRKSFDYRLYDS